MRDGLRVRLVAERPIVRVALRGDYDFADAVDVRTLAPAVTTYLLGVAVTGRWNLGALTMWGARARFEVRAPVRRSPVIFSAGILAGGETGQESDAQGRSVSVTALPLMARGGIALRGGVFSVALYAGGGARWTLASLRSSVGDVTMQAQWVPAVSGSLALGFQTGPGLLSFESGVETGVLDTVPARGTLGGLAFAVGWGIGL
jgi:hypothetical protein